MYQREIARPFTGIEFSQLSVVLSISVSAFRTERNPDPADVFPARLTAFRLFSNCSAAQPCVPIT